MKILFLAALPAAAAFAPAQSFRASTFVSMAEYDLDYGMKNDYVPASAGDGGQGQFGAVSPNNWRVPGTSPVGESSYAGAADGGDAAKELLERGVGAHVGHLHEHGERPVDGGDPLVEEHPPV